MISPNGIAHIQLTVRDVAASRPFYHHLLVETFGMAIQYDVAGQVFYCIGARTGVLILVAVIALFLVAGALILFLANGWYSGIVSEE